MRDDKQRTGGPAFPQNDGALNRINNEDGMTLRDYFAAKAMQGLLAQATPEWSYVSHVGLSRDAFAIADALLAERAK